MMGCTQLTASAALPRVSRGLCFRSKGVKSVVHVFETLAQFQIQLFFSTSLTCFEFPIFTQNLVELSEWLLTFLPHFIFNKRVIM